MAYNSDISNVEAQKHSNTIPSIKKLPHADHINQQDIDIFRSLLNEYVAHPDRYEPHIYGNANIQQCEQARTNLASVLSGNMTKIGAIELDSLKSFAFAVTMACNFPETCKQYGGYENVIHAVHKIDRFLKDASTL
ncbi:hypothetical protein [Noviherbaspirillum sp.]|uniref:hypothetical protein n=1 Tax=Noviherbaspirillum sp. TaxID=1926288 RepID=UPI002FE2F30F